MPNALLVSPKNPITFWSFDEALRMVGKKCAFPPLGLLTIAGMMPDEYRCRLVDLNVGALTDEDLEWADVVLTSSMIIHWQSLEEVIGRCNAANVPVLSGGPLPTQYCDDIAGVSVFYRGEAENGFLDVVERMVSRPGSVKRQYVDCRGLFNDLDATPLPRWDLIDFGGYSNMVVQVTRGCPESCTFCNIPALYGSKTRIKSGNRILQELSALYGSGWRGPVMAVDDNFVGNAEAIRMALEERVIPWQEERNHPFQFHTQASIRLSDHHTLLEAMWAAGFDKLFVGIESPVKESLKFMGAQKNLQGNAPLLDKVRKIQAMGFEVQAGFIMGLDTDPDDIAERMVAFIRQAGIPLAMVGILGVLRDTPDYKRFEREGRLVEGAKYRGDSGVFSRELSYVPTIAPELLIDRHRWTVRTLNTPEVYFERCLTFFANQKRQPLAKMHIRWPEVRAFLLSLWRQGFVGSYRSTYWKFLARILQRSPRCLPPAVRLAVQGHHLILTTQQALKVEEVRVFLEQGVTRLERLAQGSGDALSFAEAYAGRLKQVARDHLALLKDHKQALQYSAAVLLRAAQEYSSAVGEEFRSQVMESLDKFHEEVGRILEVHTGERTIPQSLLQTL